MARFTMRWRGDLRVWHVEDNENDRAVVAEFPTLLEAETYVIERSERSER